MPSGHAFYEASVRLVKLYLGGFVKNELRDSDMVELLGAQLRATVVLLELVDEFQPTLSPDDPQYEVRMQGRELMQRGLANVVSGGVLTLSERDSYGSAERARLLESMRESFPAIIPWLSPSARTETLVRLKTMQSDAALQDLQPGLGELRRVVESSIENAANP